MVRAVHPEVAAIIRTQLSDQEREASTHATCRLAVLLGPGDQLLLAAGGAGGGVTMRPLC
jgi:hypothetical protein